MFIYDSIEACPTTVHYVPLITRVILYVNIGIKGSLWQVTYNALLKNTLQLIYYSFGFIVQLMRLKLHIIHCISLENNKISISIVAIIMDD